MAQSLIDPVETGLTCPECDYNLTGSTSDRCPWCGWTIDVEELVAGSLARNQGIRLSVAAVALVVGAATAVVIAALLAHGKQLTWHDALAVLSTATVALAHVGLSVAALRARHRWPMRPGEASNLLRFIGWASIAAALVAATPRLSDAPTPRVVKGVQVNGILEFVMTASFFSLPGTMLLILRLVSYRHPTQKHSERRVAAAQADEDQAPFVIVTDRRYAPDQVQARWIDRPRSTDARVEEFIARTWDSQCALARQEGRTLFNGKVARLTRFHEGPQILGLELSDTHYRDFLATNLRAGQDGMKVDPVMRADALGTSAIVSTADGSLVLGRRSHQVNFHAGFLHPFGGLLEEADRTPGGYDVFGGIMRELTEELGIRRDDVASIAVIGMVRDTSIQQPELIFDVCLKLTRAELRARFASRGEEDEHTTAECLGDDPESVLIFLGRTARVTPVAQAGLLLHGRHAWGADWYDQACYTLYGSLPAVE